MALVSVIVPIYNVSKYLERGIQSLLKQTLRDIEIILINDGSTDNSLEICKIYAKKDNRIKIIDKVNEGVSVARNSGIGVASSDYISFFDPDDEIEETIYEKLYMKIVNDNSDICLCNYLEISDVINEVKLPYKEGKYDREIINNLLLDMIASEDIRKHPIAGTPWRGIYKKKIIENHNIKFPPNIRPMQDLIFNINYLLNCNTISINDNYLYKYYSEIGTGVRGYKENYFENGKKVFEFIEKINIEGQYKIDFNRRLSNRWFVFILNNLEMIFYLNNPHSNLEKLRIIKSILRDSKTKRYITAIHWNKYPWKIKFLGYCIKYQCSLLLLFYYNIVKVYRKL